MKKKRWILYTLPSLAAVALLAGCAPDTETPTETETTSEMGTTTGTTFSALDTNGDGFISNEEAAAHQALMASWETADTNGDGQIDQSEFSAFEAKP